MSNRARVCRSRTLEGTAREFAASQAAGPQRNDATRICARLEELFARASLGARTYGGGPSLLGKKSVTHENARVCFAARVVLCLGESVLVVRRHFGMAPADQDSLLTTHVD
ncbi:hypothetical protein MTO96_030164 [Rhipicephalus appendiculatus]